MAVAVSKNGPIGLLDPSLKKSYKKEPCSVVWEQMSYFEGNKIYNGEQGKYESIIVCVVPGEQANLFQGNNGVGNPSPTPPPPTHMHPIRSVYVHAALFFSFRIFYLQGRSLLLYKSL